MESKGFIEHYLTYNKGNMVPPRFHIWSAISILGMALSRKVFIDHSYFKVYPTLYICMVARPAIRKSTAKNIAKNMFTFAFPGYPIGSSVASREKIVERLSSEHCLRKFTDHNGIEVEYHPMAIFVNELKNFMSINPGAMIEFLTDIYDEKFFDAATIKHGLQPIINPCLSILACENPGWIIDKLKQNIIGGGFSRRMLYVYELERPPKITFPILTDESKASEVWCLEHLKKVDKLIGPFTWESQATKDKFDQWYKSLPDVEDPVMEDFYEAKDILSQKVAMCLAAAEPEPKLVLTWNLLEKGINAIGSLEENLPKLTMAVGRNDLAVPQNHLMQKLHDAKGYMSEKQWHRLASKDMNEVEYTQTKQMLIKTEQIVEMTVDLPGGLKKNVIYTMEAWKAAQEAST